VTAYDVNGNHVDAASSDWTATNGYGHQSFMLNTLLPKAAGNRGLLIFSTQSGALHITGLGLRVTPANSFTSIPKLAAPGQ
jgi:hypothetical protein